MTTSILATFSGTPSLGYVPNTKYLLHVKGLSIRRYSDGQGYCEYGSLEAFLKNWCEINVLKIEVKI